METDYNQEDTQPPTQLNSNLDYLHLHPRRLKKQYRLKIDVTKTEYPLLRTVATAELGWRVWTREQSKEQINLYWVDTYVHDQFVRRMKPYQRVNHIPGSQNLGKKNLLWNNIQSMKKHSPKEYQFFPITFNFPAELEQFQKSKNNQQQYYIVKPCSDSQGRGIFLTRQPDTASKEQVVVQQYIENPLLIEKAKFDLRVYVLLRSVAPLKIYIYEQGLSRLATCQYQKPQSSNQRNMRMHLTNYAINKLSPNFIFNRNENQDHLGHKRSYTATLKIMQTMGCDIEHLQLEIDKIIVKTVIAVQNTMAKKYREIRDNKEQHESVCFEVLGFDILIKQNFQPLLLQVNHSPSFCTETPLDFTIKKHLILDTLTLLNLNPDDKLSYIKSRNQQDNINSNQIYKSYSKNVPIRQQQPEEAGCYRKIYPIDHLPHLQQLSKTYQGLIKLNKQQKVLRPPPIRSAINSLGVQAHLHRLRNELDSVIAQNTERTTRSLSLYHVINDLKCTRLKQLREVIDFQPISPPSAAPQIQSPTQKEYPEFLSNKSTPESPSTRKHLDPKRKHGQQHLMISNGFLELQMIDFNPEEQQLIRKQEVTMYERRIKKDQQKQKRKYILPMPINNVNIRLDDRFLHRTKQPKPNIKQASNQQSFKIHSLFNATCVFDRRKHKDDGKRTALEGGREQLNTRMIDGKTDLERRTESKFDDRFKMNERSNRLQGSNCYSLEIKQKIQRMQLAKVRLQKMKKLDKASFIIIKSHVPEKTNRVNQQFA